MTLLGWKKIRNLENSLVEFLQNQISSQNLKVLDLDGNEKDIQVRAGYKIDESWELPVISVYVDNIQLPRLSIGSNCRLPSYLMIIDIRALDVGSQLDLTQWVEETINNGWDFYYYSPNSGSPDNPTKVKTGYVSIDFISNTSVKLGENADLFDKYRQNITISCTIA